MKFRRIYIKNFQSIKELELILDENGCYHIKGKNNIGKSAFLKALKMIVCNVSRNLDKYIRDGEESFYIEVSDFDYNTVILSRGKEDYYKWTIGNESGRVDGTQGKVPLEVKNFFNFYEEMDKSKEIVNIRPARSKLLFADTSSSENYYLLQKALRIEEYLKAIKHGEKVKKEKKRFIQDVLDREEETHNDIVGLKNYNVVLDDLGIYINTSKTYENQLDELLEVLDLFNRIDTREKFLGNAVINFDSEKVRKDTQLLSLLVEAYDLMKIVNIKESSIESKKEVVENLETILNLSNELKEKTETVDLIKNKNLIEVKIENLESSISKKSTLLNEIGNLKLSHNLNLLESGFEIISSGKHVREKINNVNLKKADYLKSEEERKQFMIDNKFCPVVLSMVDKKCPFSGKNLEELLSNK